MARPKKEHIALPNGFVASAVQMPLNALKTPTTTQAWMRDAWRYYDTIGELHFVANWIGNMLSRGELVAAKRVENEYIPETDGPAYDAMMTYFDGPQGQEEMLRYTGIHLTIPGELYQVYIAKLDEWLVLPSDAVKQDRSKSVTFDVGGDKHKKTNRDVMIRMWTPHARDPLLADSPVRSNLGTLSEINRLNQHVTAQLDSRLAGAGILFVPSEIQFATPEGMDPNASNADVFMKVLGDAMITPLRNRENASATVPIVVSAPGDDLGKVQHITFWSELDSATIEMRNAALKRLALGLDTPPEVLLGVADTNHWSAWMVDEASIKAHLEPRLGIIAHGITKTYLRPALKGVVENPDDYLVLADTAKIRMRPNRANEAIELYDRLVLNDSALRRETGFDPEDAPDDNEFIAQLLRKIATANVSPETAVAALEALGLSGIGQTDTPIGQDNRTRIDSRRDAENVGRPPRGDRTEQDQRRVIDVSALDHPVVAAADALVVRALERAGNKMCDARARANGLGDVPACDRYLTSFSSSVDMETLMDGAWATAPKVLNRYTDDVDGLIASLDLYTRSLISLRREHTVEGMRDVLMTL